MNPVSVNLDSQGYGIREFLRSLYRHKRKTLALALGILALTVVVILFAPRKYQSEGKLYIQIGRESVTLDPTATTGEMIPLQQTDRSQEIATVIDVLNSRGVLEQVVDSLGPEVVLGKSGEHTSDVGLIRRMVSGAIETAVGIVKSIDPISPREEALIRLERNLEVEAQRDSTLISIRYDTKSPKLAQLVAQSLMDAYRSEHLRLHRTSGSREFFAQQHSALENKLNEVVGKLRDAKNRLHMVSIESRRETLENRLASIELSRVVALQQVAAAEARVSMLKKQIDTLPARMVSEETTLPNTGADALREQLYLLQVILMEQEAKFNSDHPALQATRKQVREAEAMLAQESRARQETTSDVNPNYQSLALSLASATSELAALQAGKYQLEDQRTQVLGELKVLNDHELEIDQLEREAQLAREKYFRYADNLEQARIDEELDNERISNVIIAQHATLAEKPVSPKKSLLVGLALVLTLAAAVALVCFCELINDRIYTADQLQKSLQLPVLGVVPQDPQLAGSIH